MKRQSSGVCCEFSPSNIIFGKTFIELVIVVFEMRGSFREACATDKLLTSVVGMVVSTLLSIVLAEILINSFRTVILLPNTLLSRGWFASGDLCTFKKCFVMADYS